MRRNLKFLVPTHSSCRVDQLCLLPRCVSTVGSPEIMKGSVVPFFFLLSLVSCTVPPSFLLFPLCFSFLSLSFFLFIFLYLFFPYPSSTDFFLLDLRKFPPSFSSLSHGHVSSHGPSIMCHVSPCEPCAMCHVSHRHML